MTFDASPFQQAYFDWIRKGKGNAQLQAVAGAGKTTTLLHGCEHMPAGTTGYAVVFNRKNADELRSKFPRHVTCGTFHSLWMRAARQHLGNGVRVDTNKTAELLLSVMPTTQYTDRRTGTQRTAIAWEYRNHASAVRKLVGLAKGAGVGPLLPDTQETYEELMDYYDIDLDEGVEQAEVIAYARRTLMLGTNERLDVIDFDDMLYMPLVHGWSIEQRDFVFVDEAQDTNAVQRALVARMVKPKGRLVFVGDPHQAIYGFRGATSEAMEIIAKQFKTTALPLTVSFRCPKAVVQKAREYVAHITAHDTAAEGEVQHVPAAQITPDLLTRNTAIVCRTTAPLVQLAYRLIGRKVSCCILGRDIGVGLKSLAQKMKPTTLLHLSTALNAYLEREVERATDKGDEAKVQSVTDKVESLQALISDMPPGAGVDDLYAVVDELFADTSDGKLTLCTVHKAKGLEWDQVCIARPDLIPLPWVKKDWQVQQERNIGYVAVTRAKRKLVLLEGDKLEFAR